MPRKEYIFSWSISSFQIALILRSFRFFSVFIARGTIGAARGAKETMFPKNFLENTVILCFEGRFSKQNSVIRLKSNILPPPSFLARPNFWTGYSTAWHLY